MCVCVCTCVYVHVQVDTPPLPQAVQDGAKCFSPILPHTLTVVLWPKFGHSTTLNNKGYKAHKEMGSVS